MIVEVVGLRLLASSGRVPPYINDAESPSCRASRPSCNASRDHRVATSTDGAPKKSKVSGSVFTRIDRCLWVWLSRVWSAWRSALIIVKPEIVINGHRQGFRWYCTWRVRHGGSGVPKFQRKLAI